MVRKAHRGNCGGFLSQKKNGAREAHRRKNGVLLPDLGNRAPHTSTPFERRVPDACGGAAPRVAISLRESVRGGA
eukprot:gene19378-biopygen5497